MMQLIDPSKTDTSGIKIGLILPGKPEPAQAAPKIVTGFDAAPDGSVRVVDKDGEATSSMTWAKFLDLRPTTCRPLLLDPAEVVDRPHPSPPEELPGASYGELFSAEELAKLIAADQLEDLDQATHEFVGEVAELGELVCGLGIGCFVGEPRAKLIDECGDILFTGSWAIDAWCRGPAPDPTKVTLESISASARPGGNPLRAAVDTEVFRVADDHPLAVCAQILVEVGPAAIERDHDVHGTILSQAMQPLVAALVMSGLTANAFKKLRFQRREQANERQVIRIIAIMEAVNALLILANSSIEEAMLVNRAKLDKRFPGGYRPGQGGGIRTEG